MGTTFSLGGSSSSSSFVATAAGGVSVSAELSETGVTLPMHYEIVDTAPPYFALIMTHGLGSSNPKTKSHNNDRWISEVLIPGAKLSQMSYVSYTTRGHGESTGWEESAQSNPEQFQWKYLSNDMNAVSNYIGVKSYIAAGSSMGSATALYSAAAFPKRVKGLILLRPPTAWEERVARRGKLLSNADACEQANPGQPHHHVLRGTAYSDLPSQDDRALYSKIKCPVLILTIKGDPAHPLSTAYELSRKMPQSTLHTADNAEQASKQWPHIVKNFINDININAQPAGRSYL